MKFTKIVFWIAGIWGVVTLAPLYFMAGIIGRQDPPEITHQEFYYGFLGVTLVWQLVLFVIAQDPARFRPLILLSVFEKLTYVLAVVILCVRKQMAPAQSLTVLPDALLLILFVIAFRSTRGLEFH